MRGGTRSGGTLSLRVPNIWFAQIGGMNHLDLYRPVIRMTGMSGGAVAEPLYRQIADDLLGQIESGQLPQAGRLPTENELMEQYNASRNTIRDAIKLLTTR
ncbi:MAG: GntR family transcriptional regulator, partial [Actinobacteria bacterium]|nr:GntR family transcriptional regulator [Actinomycetota bacterium]